MAPPSGSETALAQIEERLAAAQRAGLLHCTPPPPSSAQIGCRVTGCDLTAGPPSTALARALKGALAKWKVLFFPGALRSVSPAVCSVSISWFCCTR
jgi:hypothetical protein